MPDTCAPSCCNHKDNHDPLKPVWPVIKTFLCFQKVGFTIFSMGLSLHSTKFLKDSFLARYPWVARSHHGSVRPFDYLLLAFAWVLAPIMLRHLGYNRRH